MKTLFPLTLYLLAFLFSYAGNPDFSIVPFELYRNIIIVQAEADNHTGSFILDTGVAELTLNSRYFKGHNNNITFYDIHGNASDAHTMYTNLKLGDCQYRNLYVKAVDFEALETELQLPILGCIGINVFRQCELVLDYIFQELTIYQLDEYGNRKSTNLLHEYALDTLYFKVNNNMPIITMKFGGQSLSLGLDSGASSNLLNETLEAHLDPHWSHLNNRSLTGISGQIHNLKAVQIKYAQVGRLYCQPMKTVFAPLEQFQDVASMVNMHIDGILGYEFLKQFRVAINFHKKEMYLWNKEKVETQLAMRKETEQENKNTNKSHRNK